LVEFSAVLVEAVPDHLPGTPQDDFCGRLDTTLLPQDPKEREAWMDRRENFYTAPFRLTLPLNDLEIGLLSTKLHRHKHYHCGG
jgi:hypothetical protein